LLRNDEDESAHRPDASICLIFFTAELGGERSYGRRSSCECQKGRLTGVLRAKDVPKRWEDLLDPKWNGKLGMVTGVGHIDYLAIRWGEKKFLDFGRALAKQKPVPGKLGELYTRLQIGEIALTTTLTNSFIIRAQKEGAPLEHAQVQPVVAPAYHIGALKGSRHPNTAHLFASFLLSPEAQAIWERYNGQTSAFVPGTKMYNYVQGKDVIYLGQDDVDLVNRAVVEVNKILGFNP